MKSLNQKHILVVRSGYPSKEFVLKRLKDLGYYVIILDTQKNCPDELVDDWILADLYDYDASIKAIEKYLANPKNHIDGAITFWEEAVFTTAAITEHFGWIGLPLKSVEEIKNKHAFRELCRANNLPSPRSHLLSSRAQDYAEVTRDLTFPVVVKPLYGAASAFVTRVDEPQQLEKAYQTIKESIQSFWLAPEWKSIDLYVEEYIDGQEVDIDILLQDGTCVFYSITDNFQTQEPYFIETGQALPSSLSQDKQDALIEMALAVLKSAGVTDGCIHFEAKSSTRGPVPVEINLRMGGDHVYTFIKDGWGVDMVEQAAKIAVGDPIKPISPRAPLHFLEGKYFEPERPGVITDIVYHQEILTDPHLAKLHFDMKEGEKVEIPPRGFDFFGWITSRGKTKQEAQSHLARLFSEFKFEVKPL